MKYPNLIAAFLMILMVSCSIGPEPINYNQDECSYCKMQISDSRFGAEMVTSKGKIYKYDSAECLVRTYIEKEKQDYAFIQVTDYSKPHNLIDASVATFFVSKNQPSPMGGDLSAYQDKEMAAATMAEKGGKLFNFEELINEYRELY